MNEAFGDPTPQNWRENYSGGRRFRDANDKVSPQNLHVIQKLLDELSFIRRYRANHPLHSDRSHVELRSTEGKYSVCIRD